MKDRIIANMKEMTQSTATKKQKIYGHPRENKATSFQVKIDKLGMNKAS